MFKRLTPFFLLIFLSLGVTANALEIGQRMPSFSGTDMDGKPVDLAEVIGKHPVMVVFWASWCPNCKSEVPKINNFYKKYGSQGMTFIGVNVGFNDSVRRARAFMESTQMAYPVLFDAEGAVSYKYKVQGVPTIIVADKNGRVAYKDFGVREITEKMFKRLNQ